MSVSVKNPGLSEIDELCVQAIRFLSMEGVQQANSGHPGMPMGMAPAAYVLWTKHMKHDPANPRWHNRDRFVLSAGHGCMLLYSLLHLTGYNMSLDELKNFRQWGSKTPGHPEYDPDLGVEVSTGPLGQGISNAVGMAIAQKYLANYFNREGFPIIDYKIYVIASATTTSASTVRPSYPSPRIGPNASRPTAGMFKQSRATATTWRPSRRLLRMRRPKSKGRT